MRVDSSGRIGIGTNSPKGRIDANTGTISGETGAQCIFPLSITIGNAGSSYGSIGYNLDYRNATSNTSGVKYLASDTISQIDFDNGGFIFRNAATGIAGNTATLTERLRIDSSGNIGVGTSSPNSTLHISKSGTSFPSASNPRIRLDETSSGRFGLIEFDSNTNQIS